MLLTSSEGEKTCMFALPLYGCDPEREQQLVDRVDEAGGPPPSVPTTGLRLLFDESQGTAVVVHVFDTAEGMRKGDEAFGAMDASDTPGTRVSVDRCELKLVRGRLWLTTEGCWTRLAAP